MLENSRVRGAEEKQALNIFIGDMAFCQCDYFLVSFNQKKKTKHDYFFLCSFLFLVGKKQQGKLNRKG